MNKKVTMFLGGLLMALSASAFMYDVRQPGEDLRPSWFADETVPGVWSFNVTNVFEKARAAGKCTILFNTGSWWCPYCETLESMVLSSDVWRDYVAENGFYLAMLDFPYRGTVSAEQQEESWHPELGPGWGFKCWLMSPEYLASKGLTEEQGLDAIMDLYEIQKSLALESASQVVISNWQQTAEFRYGKLGYPTFIVFGPDGVELGRTGFPWYSSADVTASEAQEYVIQAIDQIINGECRLCEDPLAGDPPTAEAQEYTGWILSVEAGVVGTVKFTTSKAMRTGRVRVGASVCVNGEETTFLSQSVDGLGGQSVVFEKRGVVVSVQFGEIGLTGTVTVDGVEYEIAGGGRNVFKANDEAALRRRGSAFTGVWNVVLNPAESVAPSPFARGFGTVEIAVKKAGTTRISGRLGDGTRVNMTSRLIVGEDGRACLPVRADLYGKKGGFGFVVWFRNGKIYAITDVAPWIAAGDSPFVCRYTPTYTQSSGFGVVQDELELSIVGMDGSTVLKGLSLAEDPSFDIVTVKGNVWKGLDTSFQARRSLANATLKGSIKFKTANSAGFSRSVTGRFYGAVMGGSGYDTIVVPGEGSWAVKIAVCGGCSE